MKADHTNHKVKAILKLATWNVNSIKVRLPQVLEWLGRQRPDVLCLQETKVEDEKFPVAEIRAAGYEPLVNGQEPLMLVRLGGAKRPKPSARRAVALVASFRNS